MAATVNLSIDQGATFARNITWKAGSPAVPVDLTGYSAKMQVRRSASSSAIVLELNTSNGGISITPLTGTIALLITAPQAASIPAGVYVHDLELTAPAGQVYRLIKGNFTVVAEVTRP